jgi:para-nitrobenzyl esterase
MMGLVSPGLSLVLLSCARCAGSFLCFGCGTSGIVVRGGFSVRFHIQISCTLVIAAMAIGFSTPARANPLKVKIEQGKIQGKFINDGKVRAFLGIPYAAPPVGDLRWKAPQPPAAWKGARDATLYGARCMQASGTFPDMAFQDAGPSEDCLYLNVFAPAHAKRGSKLPVMFWIHGGGYSGGSGDERRHDGDFLPTKGVVLVTINYRLGVFGFLATSDLVKEAGAAGNYGLMDMVAALRWVKANIAEFGGDANNVTIFGESAGSSSVCTLMAAQPARGLFEKAIGESGASLNVGSQRPEEQEDREQEWVESLGANNLAALRALPAETILAAATAKGAPRFAVLVDGRLLTEPIADTYAAGKQAHVPLLAGWNRDDAGPPALLDETAAQWNARAEKLFGDRADQFLALYPGETDEQATRSSLDYAADSFIALSTWKWVEAQVKTGDAPVYRYHFELPAPPSKFHPGWYAFHSDDIEYVFGTLDTRPDSDWRLEDWKLSEEVMDYWTNFAKTGDPNGPGLAQWPRFDKTDELIHLDKAITSGPDTLRPRYEFLIANPAMTGR